MTSSPAWSPRTRTRPRPWWTSCAPSSGTTCPRWPRRAATARAAWRPSCRSPERTVSLPRAPAQGRGGAVPAGAAPGTCRGLASCPRAPFMGLSLWPRGRAAGWLLEVGGGHEWLLWTRPGRWRNRPYSGHGNLFLGREEGKEMGMEGALFTGVSGTQEPGPSWEQVFVGRTENSDSLQLSHLLG